jgi:hypothetical protein
MSELRVGGPGTARCLETFIGSGSIEMPIKKIILWKWWTLLSGRKKLKISSFLKDFNFYRSEKFQSLLTDGEIVAHLSV